MEPGRDAVFTTSTGALHRWPPGGGDRRDGERGEVDARARPSRG
ncbi:hypothetical protein [Microtetraspora sp. NBRC 13810]|nr:hypothetical protein [Microtetraspora sp. NBRC 13810]